MPTDDAHTSPPEEDQALPEYWRQVIEDAWARCTALQRERDRLQDELDRVRPVANGVWNDLIDRLIARAKPVHVSMDITGPVYEHQRTDHQWESIADWLEWQRHSGPSGVLADIIAQRNAIQEANG